LLLEKSPNDSGLHLLNEQATQVVGTIEKMRSLLRSVQSAHLLLSLADVVASALIYARSNIHKLNSCLEIEGLNNRLWILGDAAQIQIALVNLLRNGIEAVYAGQVDSPRVQVELSRQGSFAVISVSDNGPGFVADKLDQLLLTTSKPQGSGLGLFVVQCTMDNHQGRAELLSSDLGGAKINLFFPIVQTIDS
jgi:C4-dicarboxylate-specific signal transduction histidine kinase